MHGFHERLARIGLNATEANGFALAGGYALTTNGFGNRPSMDVDLFTSDLSTRNFDAAVAHLTAALNRDGIDVHVERRGDLFANLNVHDPATGESSVLQLGCDYREFPPARLTVGPVLDERDAVANKMLALWSRGEVRDFIDVDTVLQSGRYSQEDLLTLADAREAQPLDRAVLAQRLASLAVGTPTHGAEAFARYGVDDTSRQAMIDRFVRWSTVLDPPSRTVNETVTTSASRGPESAAPHTTPAIRTASAKRAPGSAYREPRGWN